MSMLHGHDDEYEDNMKTRVRFVLFCILAVSAVFLVLLMTFLLNQKPEKKERAEVQKVEPQVKTEVQDTTTPLSELKHGSGRTSDEMGFWHMYEDPEPNSTVIPRTNRKGQDDRVSGNSVSDNEDAGNEEPEEPRLVSENEHDKRISQEEERKRAAAGVFDINELSDGKAEFADIEKDIKENPYYSEGFTTDGIWKDYALNGRKTSFRGIDVSKYQKTIDWEQVSRAGVDFAMLRMGSRGYNSGRVVIDEELQNNLNGCSNNGIQTGIYFFSQAISPEEAVEEANYCVGAVQGYEVSFPIVFDTEAIVNDSYRTEGLTKEEMSAIARAFCDTVKSYGFTPMIGATKRQFVTRFSLKDIEEYDWWLFDTDSESVFPYRYNMWQYSQTGDIPGIEGAVDLDIAFVDYTVR